MTIPSTERKAGPLLGTGAQTTWPFTFKVFAPTDIAVTIANSLGTETALVYGVDYSVSLNANQETSPGGTVTYPISGTPLPSGGRLVITGNLPYDQPLDLPAGGNFSPLALENQLDRATMQIQQLREKVGRAVQVGTTADANVVLPTPAANQLIGWDNTGEDLQNVPLESLATALGFASYRYDTFTGDGVETQFTLAADPTAIGNLDVAVSGITQTPGVDYTLATGTLVFTSAPPLGTTILARYGEGLPAGAIGSAVDVTYTPAGVGASVRTVETKLRETVSVKDFGADPAASAAANTTAIAAALAYAGTKKCGVYVPGEATAYQVNDEFIVPDGVTVFGDGWGSFIQQITLNKDVFIAGDCNTFHNLRLKIADGDNADFVNCIYAANVNNLTVENCFLEPGDLGGCGIQIRNVKNSQIRGNRIYGGKWSSGAGAAASASDILLYSSGTSERHVIEGNHCLSNNSQGIYVDALGTDGDILVANNICVTLDPATCTETGTWALIASGGSRRHSIVAGYNSSSVSGPRVVLDGNICRNTRWTGIYKQGISSGAVIISNNLCDLNGYEIGNALAGGIFILQSGYELVIGNTITNYQNTTSGDTGAITVSSSAAVNVPSEIRNNKIVGSAGFGIVLKIEAAYVTVDGNTSSGCVASDIYWVSSAGIPAAGGHRITNNVITRTTSTLTPGISLTLQASTLYTLVKNNVIRGDDNTTNNVLNAGIRRTGANAYIQIIGNQISNFYYGVIGTNFWGGGRMADVQMEGNVFIDCNTGFALGASGTAQTVPLVDNRFINVTTQSAAALGGSVAGRIVTRQGDNFVWQTTAVPTVGTWAVGDRSVNSAPAIGQPKAWTCTVAGAPGTWVSEGNL
jgi:hypothetical protein